MGQNVPVFHSFTEKWKLNPYARMRICAINRACVGIIL